ncbi:MAG: hypothetical protein ACF8CQ_13760 [Rhodopirellula sp. JB044]|uniref:hypothetical protein n=1 Tax=Rhodopirellula sp. JB044 TaxID=3342844 RepID=UPI00370A18F5
MLIRHCSDWPLAYLLIAISVIFTTHTGCENNSDPHKLTPSEEVDWDAIRERDAAMADNSTVNEDTE